MPEIPRDRLPCFVYGSNLHRPDLERWCRERNHLWPFLRSRGPAVLPDHELCFDVLSRGRGGGALDVRPAPGSIVRGFLFDVGPAGIRVLDEKEGARLDPPVYEPVRVTVLREAPWDGKPPEVVEAWTYRVHPRSRRPGHVPPAPRYLALLDDVWCHLQDMEEGTFPRELAERGDAESCRLPGFFLTGTLLRWEPDHGLVGPCGDLQCLLLATCLGELRVRDGRALLLPPRGNLTVEGEYVITRRVADLARRLDEFHGFRGWEPGRRGPVMRVPFAVDAGDGRIRPSWAWWWDAAAAAGARPVPGGDWRRLRGTRDRFLRALARAHAPSPGDSRRIAARLARRPPFAMGGRPGDVARDLLPLWASLSDGTLSERRLAQESNLWVARPARPAHLPPRSP